MSNAVEVKRELAREAIGLQIELDEISDRLNEKKEELRDLANGKTMNIIVEGLGKVDVTEPRAGTDKVTFTFDEDKLTKIPDLRKKLVEKGVAKEVLVIDDEKLGKIPELKQKLLEKGVMAEKIKKISAAKASVRIKPNV